MGGEARERSDRELAAFCVFVVAVFVGGLFADRLATARGYTENDFLPMYCATRILATGRDPYRTEPLASCERDVQTQTAVAPAARYRLVKPVPYAPAILLLFRPVASLPVLAAGIVYAVLSLAAFAITVLGLARIVPLPWWAIATALAPADLLDNVTVGQWVPFLLAALVATGAALACDRPRLAGALATATLLQPNVGLPVLAALFVLEARARAPIAIGLALFGGAGLLAGPGLSLEYVTRVVPAQALAEVTFVREYSLTWLAWLCGASPAVAIRLGALQYLAIVAAAIAGAGRLARALGSRAAIVFAPAAAAITFGSYAHENQLAVAFPLALLIATRGPARFRLPGWLVVLAASTLVAPLVVWQSLLVLLTLRFGMPAATVRNRLGAAVLIGLGIAVAYGGIENASHRPLRAASDVASYLTSGPDLALAAGENGLEARRLQDAQQTSALALAEKLPGWSALLLLATLAGTIVLRDRSGKVAQGASGG